jgi:DNA-directed RNA polymerase specialized sigma24 family protein
VKEKLCRRLLEDKKLKVLAQRLGGSQWEDVLQEVAVLICEYPDPEKLDKWFNFWCARVIMNMTSSTGQIGKLKSRRIEHCELVEFEYDHEIDKQFEEVNKILDGMDWYDRELFKTYVEEGSLRNVEKRIGIKYGSVWNTVDKVRKQVNEEWEKR